MKPHKGKTKNMMNRKTFVILNFKMKMKIIIIIIIVLPLSESSMGKRIDGVLNLLLTFSHLLFLLLTPQTLQVTEKVILLSYSLFLTSLVSSKGWSWLVMHHHRQPPLEQKDSSKAKKWVSEVLKHYEQWKPTRLLLRASGWRC
jgi:hypothetical protein